MTPNRLAKLKSDVLAAARKGGADEAARLVREAGEELSLEELQAFNEWARAKTEANLRRFGGTA